MKKVRFESTTGNVWLNDSLGVLKRPKNSCWCTQHKGGSQGKQQGHVCVPVRFYAVSGLHCNEEMLRQLARYVLESGCVNDGMCLCWSRGAVEYCWKGGRLWRRGQVVSSVLEKALETDFKQCLPPWSLVSWRRRKWCSERRRRDEAMGGARSPGGSWRLLASTKGRVRGERRWKRSQRGERRGEPEMPPGFVLRRG